MLFAKSVMYHLVAYELEAIECFFCRHISRRVFLTLARGMFKGRGRAKGPTNTSYTEGIILSNIRS